MHKPATSSAHSLHLDGPWQLWRQVCLRGAGFPIEMMEELASRELFAVADKYVTWLEEHERSADVVSAYFQRQFELVTETDRKALRQLERQFKRGRLSVEQAKGFDSHLSDLIRRFEEARNACDDIRKSCEESYSRESTKIQTNLWDVVYNDRFQEALIWQNRRLWHFLKRRSTVPDKAGSRFLESTIASYLQRYCTKNETIGSFGPIGWGEFSEEAASMNLEVGDGLVSRRVVHFEYWAVDSLCRVFEREPAVKRSLRPRLHPAVASTQSVSLGLYRRDGSLSPLDRSVLKLSDGTRTASEIAFELADCSDPSLGAVASIFAALERLANDGLIVWSVLLPVTRAPELELRKILQTVEDSRKRESLLSKLDELILARDCVERVGPPVGGPGWRRDPEQLDKAIEHLEEEFTRTTGCAPNRKPGQLYAGRGLVYEDCERDVTLEFGPAIRQELGPPLALILQSARWFDYRIAEAFSRAIGQVFEACCKELDVVRVPLLTMFPRLARLRSTIVRRVAEDLRERWGAILNYEAGSHRVSFQVDVLKADVHRLFDAPHGGWPSAQFHSPDIALAAGSCDDVVRGRYQFVLCEVHTAAVTMLQPFLRWMHPTPAALIAGLDDYRADLELDKVVSRHYPVGHRTTHDRGSGRDLKIALDETPCDSSPKNVVPISDLSVEACSTGLLVNSKIWKRSFQPSALFRTLLSPDASTKFDVRPIRDHLPRLSIGRLVVCRETWRVPIRTAPFVTEKSSSERFLQAQRWRRAYRMPRRVFVRLPLERKPVFLDFASPPLIDLFAKFVRHELAVDRNAVLTVSEMLPTPEQCWLVDAASNHFTSELRMTVVDSDGICRAESGTLVEE